jgi:hypothetical protein
MFGPLWRLFDLLGGRFGFFVGHHGTFHRTRGQQLRPLWVVQVRCLRPVSLSAAARPGLAASSAYATPPTPCFFLARGVCEQTSSYLLRRLTPPPPLLLLIVRLRRQCGRARSGRQDQPPGGGVWGGGSISHAGDPQGSADFPSVLTYLSICGCLFG